MFILGITGPVASGKSTVVEMLAELGIPAVLADKVAHGLQDADAPCTQAIVDAFGGNMLAANGAVDRRRLGSIVVNSPEKLATLNKIMHPAVRQEVESQIEKYRTQKAPFLALEVPLLYQGGYDTLCNKVALCMCNETERKKRALARPGMTAEKLDLFDSKQLPLSELKQRVDVFLETDLPYKSTKAQLEKLIEKWEAANG